MKTHYRLTLERLRARLSPGGLAALLLAAGLAATWTPAMADEPEVEAETGQEAGQETGQDPALDEEAMFQVLAAEVAGADGDMETAAADYLAAALASEDPAVAQRAVNVALAAQAFQHAAMAADRWVLLEPESVPARETAVRALLLAGDYVGAEHQLSGLLELRADQPLDAWSTVAGLLTLSRHTEKTDQILERLISAHEAGDNAFALFARSQVAVRNGDLQGAFELAARAVEQAPDRVELQAWAGRLAINLGEPDTATGYFERAWRLVPEDRNLALLYANVLRQQGKSMEAQAVLGELPDEPELRFTRIAFALESDDRAAAEELYAGFSGAAYQDPADSAFQAARSAELLDLPAEAVDWYARVDGGERGLIALVRRAVLLARLDRVPEAREVLAAAREGGDEEVVIESLIAESQILIEEGESAAAFSLLEEAIERRPDDVRLLYTRALVAVELDRLEVAEADLRHALEVDPENAAALNALGYTLADRTERFEEAEQYIRAAYALQPEEASIIDSMGWIAYRRGRLEEAEAYLREALERESNAEIAAHLGEVLWVMGREDDARAAWEEGREIDADNKVLQETMRRFEDDP